MEHAPRRLVFLGAGAIGAGLGGLLWESGQDVLLIARGPHGEALRRRGLDLRLPGGPRHLQVPVGELSELRDGDLLLLSTMGHDTAEALRGLPPGLPVVSLQNGISPLEKLGPRPIIATMVFVPAERREPGVISLAGLPAPGAVFLGAWPGGLLGPDAFLAEALRRAGFRAEVKDPMAPWVRAKALTNLGGAHFALCDAPPTDLVQATVEEARACFTAAGLEVVPDADFDAAIGPMEVALVDGLPRVGGSTRHALARGDRLETASLHGYFVRLGQDLGIPTPLNAGIIALAERASAEGWRPGALSAEELRRALGEGGPPHTDSL